MEPHGDQLPVFSASAAVLSEISQLFPSWNWRRNADPVQGELLAGLLRRTDGLYGATKDPTDPFKTETNIKLDSKRCFHVAPCHRFPVPNTESSCITFPGVFFCFS